MSPRMEEQRQKVAGEIAQLYKLPGRVKWQIQQAINDPTHYGCVALPDWQFVLDEANSAAAELGVTLEYTGSQGCELFNWMYYRVVVNRVY